MTVIIFLSFLWNFATLERYKRIYLVGGYLCCTYLTSVTNAQGIFTFNVLLPPVNWRLDTLLLIQGKPSKSILTNYFNATALFHLSRLSFLAIYNRS